MSYNPDSVVQSAVDDRDAGLRAYMLGIYNYMAAAVALTGVIAWAFAHYGYAQSVMTGYQGVAIMFSPLIIVMVMSFAGHKLSVGTLQVLFWSFAALNGLSLSTVFLAYAGTDIARAFFAAAGAFAGLSLFGYTTKRDLGPIGAFCFMALFGLIIASVINLFFVQSETMDLVLSYVTVLVFAGLTAWDTQKLKDAYHERMSADSRARITVHGALMLYLDFINIFLALLRIMGRR